jgi:two-component sensor histidine kinase
VSDRTLSALHLITDVVTALSCISICAAIVWLLTRARSVGADTRRATILMGVFVVACAVARLGDLVEPWMAGLLAPLEAFAAGVMCVAAFAIWPIVRRLRRQPSRRELIEANERLATEDEERRRQIERLTDLNAELERRVCERTRDLAEAKQRFEIALDGSPISVAQQDRELRYTWIYNPPAIFAARDFVGHTAEEVVPSTTARAQDEVKRRVLASGVAERFEVSARVGERTHWFEGRVEPLIRDGVPVGVVSVGIDVTRHKEYEHQLRIVMRELTHRSKNLLAVVLGIARQTAETVDTLPAFMLRFGARLQALSAAHELLVERSWVGVDLLDLVKRELGPESETTLHRVHIDGEAVTLGPEAAQNLAMALHELVANAHLHGALSGEGGSVEVSWSRRETETGRGLELIWREQGGPAVGEPQRRGYGRLLLERLIPRAIEGTADLTFEPTGIRYRLTIPATRLVEE